MSISQSPRINLTVSPELDTLLGKFADALGVPKATAVVNLLEQNAWYLNATADALVKARGEPLEALSELMAGVLAENAKTAHALSQEVLGVVAEARSKAAKLKSTPTRRKGKS